MRARTSRKMQTRRPKRITHHQNQAVRADMIGTVNLLLAVALYITKGDEAVATWSSAVLALVGAFAILRLGE